MKRSLRLISLLAALILCLSVLSSAALADGYTGWKKDDTGKWYYYENDAEVTGWRQIGSYWYYLGPAMCADGVYTIGSGTYCFDASGRMVTGWKSFIGSYNDESGQTVSYRYWMYFDENGRMVTGWQLIDEVWYRFDPEGVMWTGWYNSDPAFFSDGSTGGSWFYLDPSSGKMITGWKLFPATDDTERYWAYFDENGRQVTGGWQLIDEVWYYFDEDGVMLSDGLYKFGDYKYYYFLPSGRMVTGWQRVTFQEDDGSTSTEWLYFQENGLMKYAGWLQDGTDWYYFEDGLYYRDMEAAINGHYYFFQSSGRMLTGWKYLDDNWHYYNSSGQMVEDGRITDAGKIYYIYHYNMLKNSWVYNNYYGSSGAMLVNTTQAIGGITYTFDANGNSTPTHFEILS